MAIKLPKHERDQAIASIKRYFEEELDQDVGDLKASLLLDYFLVEIGAVVYNRAIDDAAKWFHERASDLEGSCHEREFGYWPERE